MRLVKNCMAAVLTCVFACFAWAIEDTKSVTYDFEQDARLKPPKGFTSHKTGTGRIGTWIVVASENAPSGKQVVQQTDNDPTDGRFSVLIADHGEYGDVDLSVKGYAVDGKVDQGMGLVFRFRDHKSYYICRANALEDNFRLYKMVDGKRLQFAGANVKVPTHTWHSLRVVAKGDHIVCYFNGKPLIDAHDKSYDKGKIGLWTKADSIISFDDLTVSPAK